jgi:DNA-binding protein H-NS
MSWWKGDDRWSDCPEFNGLPDAAVALFFRAQARVALSKSDGVLTADDFDRIDASRPRPEREAQPWPALVVLLVDRGVLVVDGEDQWWDIGWFKRNPSSAESSRNQTWRAIRKEKSLANKRGDADLVAELEVREKAAKVAYWDEKGAREAAAATGEHVSERVPEPVLERASRPVPSRPVDEEREKGLRGRGRGPGKPAAPAAGAGAVGDFQCGRCRQWLPWGAQGKVQARPSIGDEAFCDDCAVDISTRDRAIVHERKAPICMAWKKDGTPCTIGVKEDPEWPNPLFCSLYHSAPSKRGAKP